MIWVKIVEMRGKFFPILILILAFLAQAQVRPAYVAGMFYPASSTQLRTMVEKLLQQAPEKRVHGEIKGLVSPHAGYIYSGRIAAAGYKLLRGKRFDTVIVLGPSHRYPFRGAAVYDKGAYSTPLGQVEIDEQLASEMIKAGAGFFSGPEYHRFEHSIEVQIPFLQVVLGKFKLVPVVIGPFGAERLLASAGEIAKLLRGRNFLIVASSDLSHYHTRSFAYEKDSYTIKLILSFKPGLLLRQAKADRAEACGAAAIALAQAILKKLGVKEAVLIARGDSADAGGPEDKVVGYASIAFVKKEADPPRHLTEQEKEYLLRIARQAVKSALEGKNFQVPEPPTERLKEKGAAFVTIKKKGKLRGCIGFIRAIYPLYQTVKIAAVLAAFKDPRFPPIRKEEYPELEFEISVLTPMKPSSPSRVIVGRHGIMIYYRGLSGLLLPQVATENGWTRDEFLSHTCLKAGAPPDCWKRGAKIYTFEAEVFSEK